LSLLHHLFFLILVYILANTMNTATSIRYWESLYDIWVISGCRNYHFNKLALFFLHALKYLQYA
jgi:hypothetical protein